MKLGRTKSTLETNIIFEGFYRLFAKWDDLNRLMNLTLILFSLYTYIILFVSMKL